MSLFVFFLIEVWLAKISLSNLISLKSYRRKTFGGLTRPPLDQEGLKEHVGPQHKFQFPRTVTHAKACRQLGSFVVRLNRTTLQTPVYRVFNHANDQSKHSILNDYVLMLIIQFTVTVKRSFC